MSHTAAVEVCPGFFCAICGAKIDRPRKGPQPRYCKRPRRCRQRAYELRHGIKPGRIRYRRG